jgi:hypothetical protein
MISICCTYYRSLTLANLAAALYSIRQQNFAHVQELIVVDNNTDDEPTAIREVIDALAFPVPVTLDSIKHGDRSRTHAWSTNRAVAFVTTPQVLFTRADYLLDFAAVDRVVAATTSAHQFVIGGYYDLHVEIQSCEQTEWRRRGPTVLRSLGGHEYGHTIIDSGVWFTSRLAFDRVGGLDERLVAYGHAQTHFQHKLYQAGVAFVRLPEVLFYHPRHGYEVPRDLTIAHQQLEAIGVHLTDLWARYDGPDHPHYDAQGVFHG